MLFGGVSRRLDSEWIERSKNFQPEVVGPIPGECLSKRVFIGQDLDMNFGTKVTSSFKLMP